jgi:hypothetical protein
VVEDALRMDPAVTSQAFMTIWDAGLAMVIDATAMVTGRLRLKISLKA